MAERITRWTIWVAVLALALIGCGGGDGGAPDASPAPNAVASDAPEVDGSEPAATEATGSGEQAYVVESGDTLSAIAQRFDTTVEAIVEANDIKDPDAIDIGQELIVPGGQ